MILSINAFAESLEATPTPIVSPTPALILPEPFEEVPEVTPPVDQNNNPEAGNEKAPG